MNRQGTSTAILALGSTLGLLTAGCGSIVEEEAEQTFMQSLGNTTITVYPAFVRHGKSPEYDANAAKQIGEFLTARQVANVAHSDAHIPIPGPWRTNQAKMLRESATAFADYVQANPIRTSYALLPEYLMGTGGGVGGIHCYVLDADGKVAFAVLLNSHHKPFADAQPSSVADCTDVLIQVLRERLKPTQTDE
jgi:hypothetical protein